MFGVNAETYRRFTLAQVLIMPGEANSPSVRLPTVFAGNHAEFVMAKAIEFYIPARFRKAVKWVPQQQRGRVLEFPMAQKRIA